MNYTLITGASTGMGEFFAREYAKKGHPLILVARSKDKLEQISCELKKQYAIQVYVIAQDLSLINAAETLFKTCQELNIEVDFLINNAGFGLSGDFEKQALSQIQEMIILNVLTLTKLTHLFLPQLKKHRGRVLNVSSMAGFQPSPYIACYAATKAYILNFSESVNEELKNSGVSITTLAPGVTETSFFDRAGMHIDPQYFYIMKPEEAVQYGIIAAEKRRSLIIAGWPNRLFVFMLRFLPRSLVIKLEAFLIGKTQ